MSIIHTYSSHGRAWYTLSMQLWIIYALLSAVFASLVAILGKVGLKDIDSTLATTVRACIMAGFLVLLTFVLGKWNGLSEIQNKSLVFILLSGVAGALSWLAYFAALKTGPTSDVSALDRLSIVFVFVFAVLFLGEAFTWKAALGVGLIVSGAFLML